MITMRTEAGQHIRDAIALAVALADDKGEAVTFEFNGLHHDVHPEDSYEEAKERAQMVLGHPILTAEEESERARLSLEESRREADEAIAARGRDDGRSDARQRRAVKRRDVRRQFFGALRPVNRPHDYGTCVYAMSMAAVAAFYYVSGQLGVTGFQASCADMDILTRTRGLKHGFRIIDYSKVLYPQYCNSEHFPSAEDVLASKPEAFAEDARKLLAESEGGSPVVRAHWAAIAARAT